MPTIQCPVCSKPGALQWKETVTIAKGKRYSYKKLYVYHHKPKLASKSENSRAGSLARTGHEPPKLGVVGSNPIPPAKTRKETTINKNHLLYVDEEERQT